jgi:cell shape-determining protein MreC
MDGRELKQYESWKEQVQRLRAENQHLRREADTHRPARYRASVRIDQLQQRVEKLDARNKPLEQRVERPVQYSRPRQNIKILLRYRTLPSRSIFGKLIAGFSALRANIRGGASFCPGVEVNRLRNPSRRGKR